MELGTGQGGAETPSNMNLGLLIDSTPYRPLHCQTALSNPIIGKLFLIFKIEFSKSKSFVGSDLHSISHQISNKTRTFLLILNEKISNDRRISFKLKRTSKWTMQKFLSISCKIYKKL